MGSILDDLIRIKSSKQEDDLLKLLDEIPVYEKLSADEKLKDLRHSEITRKKCPMLAGFIDGNMYERTLADLAANVYLQIEGAIPAILQTVAIKTLKQQKQMEVLQSGIAQVEYRELTEYDHEEMKDMVAAVFTKKQQDVTIAVVIVRAPNGYTMYHGTYSTGKAGGEAKSIYVPLAVKGEHGILTMESYSVLGNNGYTFAIYRNSQSVYDVMIGPSNELYLMQGGNAVITYPIPWEEVNALHMAKKDPQAFAELVTSIIESVV